MTGTLRQARRKGRHVRIVIKQGRNGRWYWNHPRRNGRKLACGGEGFATASTAMRSVRTHLNAVGASARIVFDIKHARRTK